MCALENPSIAERCDCGYDFESRQMRESLISKKERATRRPAKWPYPKILVGLTIALLLLRAGIVLWRLFGSK